MNYVLSVSLKSGNSLLLEGCDFRTTHLNDYVRFYLKDEIKSIKCKLKEVK